MDDPNETSPQPPEGAAPSPTPGPKPSATPTHDAADVAADVISTVHGAAPKAQAPAARSDDVTYFNGKKRPPWHLMPSKNYARDKSGAIKMHSNGQPVKKNGRPKKGEHGDDLAGPGLEGFVWTSSGPMPRDGSAAPAPASSHVSTPEDPKPEQQQATQAAPGATAPPVDDGSESLGRLVGRGVVAACKAKIGKQAEPTTDERECIEKGLGGMFGNLRAPAWLVAGVGLLVYALRLVFLKKGDDVQAERDRADALAREQERRNIENPPAPVASTPQGLSAVLGNNPMQQ
jgi:hypothetical protein